MSSNKREENKPEENKVYKFDKVTFIRKVWFTRKARIVTSKRLKWYDTLCQILNVYYSLVLVALSIWSIVFVSDQRLVSFLILVFSITLTMFSIFYSSRNFQERYTNMKNHYISLDKFLNKINLITDDKFMDISGEIFNQYSDLLEMVENHSDFDYLSARMDSDERNRIDLKTKIYYYFFKIVWLILYIILFIFPISITYVLIYISSMISYKV